MLLTKCCVLSCFTLSVVQAASIPLVTRTPNLYAEPQLIAPYIENGNDYHDKASIDEGPHAVKERQAPVAGKINKETAKVLEIIRYWDKWRKGYQGLRRRSKSHHENNTTSQCVHNEEVLVNKTTTAEKRYQHQGWQEGRESERYQFNGTTLRDHVHHIISQDQVDRPDSGSGTYRQPRTTNGEQPSNSTIERRDIRDGLWRTIFRVLIDHTGSDFGRHSEIKGVLKLGVRQREIPFDGMDLPKNTLFKTTSPSDHAIEIHEETVMSHGLPEQRYALQVYEGSFLGDDRVFLDVKGDTTDEDLLEPIGSHQERCKDIVTGGKDGYRARLRRCIHYLGEHSHRD